MARASERRAALAYISKGSPEAEAMAGGVSLPVDPSTNHDGDHMKVQFTSVHLDIEIPRLPGGDKGLAASSTTFFDVTRTKGISIELDTATQLVRLSNSQGECFVPLSKVTRFGGVLAPAMAKSA